MRSERPRAPRDAPRVRILIPAYNSESTIGETLRSLALAPDTSYPLVTEVVVADDGSTDGTVAAVLAEPLPFPLRLIRGQRNVGQWPNTNRALESLAAETDWILLIHSDDVARASWIPLTLEAIANVPGSVGTICSSWDTLLGGGEIIAGENDENRLLSVIEGSRASVRSTLLKGTWWHISGCAVRSRTISEVGGFDPGLPYMSDLDWLIRVLAAGWGVGYIPRSLIGYRRHKGSVSFHSLGTDLDVSEMLVVLERFRTFMTSQDLRSRYGGLIRLLVRRTLRDLARGSVRPMSRRAELTLKILRGLFGNVRGQRKLSESDHVDR